MAGDLGLFHVESSGALANAQAGQLRPLSASAAHAPSPAPGWPATSQLGPGWQSPVMEAAYAGHALDLLGQVARQLSPHRIALRLGLHKNTVDRWLSEGYVPAHYTGDFLRMLGRAGLPEDQFYTKRPVAKQCYDKFREVARGLGVNLSRYTFVEPSAGCGWFYQTLPPSRRIGIDLQPRYKGIVQQDFLLWAPPPDGRYVVLGNPPFGLRGHLALQFINHAARFADLVAFILPQLFESDGKGVPAKRVDSSLRLAHSERIPADSFEKPDGTPVDISTIFQVWTKVNKENVSLPPKRTCAEFIKIYSVSNGGTPTSTRNKHMIGKCDVYLPSTCFTGMRAYDAFDELPNRRGYGIVVHQRKREILRLITGHDWPRTAFRSTNGALNLRSSLIAQVLTEAGHHD